MIHLNFTAGSATSTYGFLQTGDKMKITSTLHNHCTMCDGKSSPDEMISAAISAGFTDFGMSCHGYAPFDPEYSIPGEKIYQNAMAGLKKKYAGKIRLYTGIEEDLFAPSACPEKYDYIIGDVHYAHDKKHGRYVAIDGSAEDFLNARDSVYGGNALDLVKEYFENMVLAAEKKPDVLGHFDLIVKNNLENRFFDEESREYTEAALQALRACNSQGVVFEVNTGAVVKKRRSLPYPAPFLLKELCDIGGRVTLSADCHNAAFITGELDTALKLVKNAGFKKICLWEKGGFIEKEI